MALDQNLAEGLPQCPWPSNSLTVVLRAPMPGFSLLLFQREESTFDCWWSFISRKGERRKDFWDTDFTDDTAFCWWSEPPQYDFPNLPQLNRFSVKKERGTGDIIKMNVQVSEDSDIEWKKQRVIGDVLIYWHTLWSSIFFIKRIVGSYPKPNVHIPITEICSSITHANCYFIYLKLVIPGWTYWFFSHWGMRWVLKKNFILLPSVFFNMVRQYKKKKKIETYSTMRHL